MRVKHDFKNDVVSIIDYDGTGLYTPKPKVKEPSEIKNPKLIDLLGGRATIVEPDNGEFLIKFVGADAINVTHLQYEIISEDIMEIYFPNSRITCTTTLKGR